MFHTEGSGRADVAALILEALATARSQRVATVVAALILAAVCAVVFATTGQSAASEARVVGQVEAAGSRTLVFGDPAGSAGLVAHRLGAISKLDGVEWIVAIGPASDTTNTTLGAGGTRVSTRALYTELPPSLVLDSGRRPGPGEAVVGSGAAAAAGLSDVVGELSSRTAAVPVVGRFAASSPLGGLAGTALVRSRVGADQPMQTLVVVARSISDVPELQAVIPGLLEMTDESQLRVDSPGILADLQRVVAGEVGANTRRLMLLVLATGLCLISVTQYGSTASRRRDFGRRRALGASRGDLILLVLTQVLVSAVLGVVVGTVAGLILVHSLAGSLPDWSFIMAVALLGILSALAAALPPALSAARTDPVRILRVP